MFLRTVILGSLALNVLLAGFVFLGAKPAESATVDRELILPEPKAEATRGRWIQDSKEPPELSLQRKIGLVRRLGGNAEVVSMLITSEVRAELQRERERVFCGPTTEVWERGVTPLDPSEEQVQKLEEIRLRGEETIRSLIGAEMLAARIETYSRDPLYAGFSKAGLDAIARIDLDSEASRTAIAYAKGGPETRDSLALIESARDEDLRAILTSAEYSLYELHHSKAAWELKSQLSGIEMSEEQYEAIFRTTKAVASSENAIGHFLTITSALAAHVDSRTAVRFLSDRDVRFREVAGILSEGGIADSEILNFHQAAVLSDNDPAVISEMAERLSPELAKRFRNAKGKESGRHHDAHP